jgi:hypothetical protein
MYYVHVTINVGQREYEITLPQVKSLDGVVEFMKENYPDATSMVLSLCPLCRADFGPTRLEGVEGTVAHITTGAEWPIPPGCLTSEDERAQARMGLHRRNATLASPSVSNN